MLLNDGAKVKLFVVPCNKAPFGQIVTGMIPMPDTAPLSLCRLTKFNCFGNVGIFGYLCGLIALKMFMDKERFDEYMFPDCPIRHVLSRISGKWPLLVIYTMHMRPSPTRFNILRRAIPDISQKMLANTLRMLVEDGLVSRKAYAEVPPRVEYALTARALSLLPHLDALIQWAEDNMAAILENRNGEVGE